MKLDFSGIKDLQSLTSLFDVARFVVTFIDGDDFEKKFPRIEYPVRLLRTCADDVMEAADEEMARRIKEYEKMD